MMKIVVQLKVLIPSAFVVPLWPGRQQTILIQTIKYYFEMLMINGTNLVVF
jgi:hypothetical protein